METEGILLDTSILVEYHRKQIKSKSILFNLIGQYKIYISVITDFEIKIGMKTESHWHDYRTLRKKIDVLPLDVDCINHAVEIYSH